MTLTPKEVHYMLHFFFLGIRAYKELELFFFTLERFYQHVSGPPMKAFIKVVSSLILVCACTPMSMHVRDDTVSGVADEVWVTIHLNSW